MLKRLFCAVSLVLFILPGNATAANRYCPSDYKEYPVWSTAQAQGKMQGIVGDKNIPFCSNEFVKVSSQGWICHKVVVLCKTAEDTQKYGCEPGKTRPTITAELPPGFGQSKIVIPKCDKRGLSRALDDSFSNESTAPLTRFVSTLERERPPSTGGGLSGADMIQRSFGANNPDPNVQKAMESGTLRAALQLGDTKLIKAVAENVGLTPEQAAKLANDRATLAPQPRPGMGVGEIEVIEYRDPPRGGAGGFGGNASPFGMFSSLFSNGSFSSALSTLFKPTQTPIQSQDQGPTPTTAPLQNAIATLLVQPERIARGGALTVSWTSLGTRNGEPCTLSLRDSAQKVITIGSAREGTVRISTSQLPNGENVITLSCPSPSNEILTREKRVQVL